MSNLEELVPVIMKLFLDTITETTRKRHLRYGEREWWMKRRQLPSNLRRRARHFDRQRWAALGGLDEMELIRELPEGLRRDIKRYLCIDLVNKVPIKNHIYLITIPCLRTETTSFDLR